MSYHSSSTIAAIATAPGQAAVAIVRLSGPESWAIAAQLLEKPLSFLQAGKIHYGWLKLNGQSLDEVLVLAFKAPKSFTGQDVIEIHCHGGNYISQAVLAACLQAGAAPAPAGAFAQRAFLNGRLDLTQAESIADLIAAEGAGLAQLATHNLQSKHLFSVLDELRQGIIALQAPIVASTDYPEEVEEPDRPQAVAALQALLTKANALLAASHQNRLLREGLKIAILGQPNAGKSSLFNALLSAQRAIVTDIAGTTRDVLRETLVIDGVLITLSDTAGLRSTEETVEALGIERSWQAAHSADVLLYVMEAPALQGLPEGTFAQGDLPLLSQLPPGLPVLLLANKADLLPSALERADVLAVSAQTGLGLEAVLAWLKAQIAAQTATTTNRDQFLALNYRQTQCLSAMAEQLQIAVQTLSQPALPVDLTTVPLSEALYQLDALVGRNTTEEVLDEVFSRFCVGK